MKFLRTVSLIALNLVLALGLVGAVSASPADAAPTKKGHTTIESGLLDLAPAAPGRRAHADGSLGRAACLQVGRPAGTLPTA